MAKRRHKDCPRVRAEPLVLPGQFVPKLGASFDSSHRLPEATAHPSKKQHGGGKKDLNAAVNISAPLLQPAKPPPPLPCFDSKNLSVGHRGDIPLQRGCPRGAGTSCCWCSHTRERDATVPCLGSLISGLLHPRELAHAQGSRWCCDPRSPARDAPCPRCPPVSLR